MNIGHLASGNIRFAIAPVDFAHAPLHPAEEQYVAKASPGRQREFRAGRTCARAALSGLGYGDCPIGVGQHREPLWPSEVVGSISHSDRLCAAVAARRSTVRAIGIDLECDTSLKPKVLEMICTPEELSWVRQHNHDDTARLGKLLFSAKESLYKCCFALTGERLGFQDARIMIDPARGTLRAAATATGRLAPGVRAGLRGAFTWLDGHVMTCFVFW